MRVDSPEARCPSALSRLRRWRHEADAILELSRWRPFDGVDPAGRDADFLPQHLPDPSLELGKIDRLIASIANPQDLDAIVVDLDNLALPHGHHLLESEPFRVRRSDRAVAKSKDVSVAAEDTAYPGKSAVTSRLR